MSGDSARAYCRATLPQVSRTFAINIELLGPRLRDAVRAAYLLCRAADALEDSWPGTPEAIGARFDEFLAAVAGDATAGERLAAAARERAAAGADLALLTHLPLVLESLAAEPPAAVAAVRRCVATLAGGMRRYATRAAARPAGASYIDDDAELSEYCWIVAGCVGVMLTELFERELRGDDPSRAARRERAPAVGEALQLTNIALDLPADVRAGRCYVPASWLAGAGLVPADLLGPPRPEAQAIASRLADRAHASLDRVADYLDTLPRRHARFRLFCLWPALWARASLRLLQSDPRWPFAPQRRRLTRGALWGTAGRSLLVAHDHAAVRRLLAR